MGVTVYSAPLGDKITLQHHGQRNPQHSLLETGNPSPHRERVALGKGSGETTVATNIPSSLPPSLTLSLLLSLFPSLTTFFSCQFPPPFAPPFLSTLTWATSEMFTFSIPNLFKLKLVLPDVVCHMIAVLFTLLVESSKHICPMGTAWSVIVSDRFALFPS